jgi:hypothetical protein
VVPASPHHTLRFGLAVGTLVRVGREQPSAMAWSFVRNLVGEQRVQRPKGNTRDSRNDKQLRPQRSQTHPLSGQPDHGGNRNKADQQDAGNVKDRPHGLSAKALSLLILRCEPCSSCSASLRLDTSAPVTMNILQLHTLVVFHVRNRLHGPCAPLLFAVTVDNIIVAAASPRLE